MDYLPEKSALETLYFNNFKNECKMLALQGLYKLICRNAGRGGALNLKISSPKNIENYLLYLNNCCLCSTMNSESLFFSEHIKKATTVISPKLKFVGLLQPLKIFKVFMTCCWADTYTLYQNWKYLFEIITIDNKNYLGYESTDIKFILTEIRGEADYIIVLWGTYLSLTEIELSKTLYFRTEPSYPEKVLLSGFARSEPLHFLKFFDYHDVRFPNCIEKWIPKHPSELLENSGKIEKLENLQDCISAVVSSKYSDPGHIHRIKLLKYMIETSNAEFSNLIHIYGFDNKLNFPVKNYKGPLPPNDKSIIMKYKYTLIAENNSIPGYMTEKIADGILSECLVFYWGCPNISDYFPDVEGICPFVKLPMDNQEKSFEIIKLALKENWWKQRLSAIIETKKLILTKFMLQHRIHDVILEDIYLKYLGEDGINILRLALWPSLKIGIPKFPIILYTGARFDYIKDMIDKRCDGKVTLKYHEGLSETIPDETPLVQEFSNPPVLSSIQHYTISNTRFCIKNFESFIFPKSFVINLESRPDRMRKFSSNFKQATSIYGWIIDRYEAVDGNKLLRENNYSDEIKHTFRNNDFGWRPAVIGCALSHINLWKKLIKDPENDSYLIFEDDVEFTDNYVWKFQSLMQKIIFDWDFLFLGHLMCYEHQTIQREEINQLPNWVSMVEYSVPKRISYVGTASYLISKRGAQKLLSHIEKNGVGHGIDYLIQLQFPNIRAYGADPMLNFAEYNSKYNPNINVDSDIQC